MYLGSSNIWYQERNTMCLGISVWHYMVANYNICVPVKVLTAMSLKSWLLCNWESRKPCTCLGMSFNSVFAFWRQAKLFVCVSPVTDLVSCPGYTPALCAVLPRIASRPLCILDKICGRWTSRSFLILIRILDYSHTINDNLCSCNDIYLNQIFFSFSSYFLWVIKT